VNVSVVAEGASVGVLQVMVPVRGRRRAGITSGDASDWNVVLAGTTVSVTEGGSSTGVGSVIV
jgi:hypothetical protein